MKKLISLILALCMGCMMVSALAEDDITGEWYASFAGVTMTMNLNADGTVVLTSPSQEGGSSGTYTREGDQLTLTVEGSPATATITEEGILLSEGGLELKFTREPVEPITVGEPKTDAAAGDYYGDWTFAYLENEGLIMDISAVGMAFPNLTLGEGKVEFVAAGEEDIFASMYNMLAFTSAFENGMLKLTATAANTSATGTVQLLTDGLIKLSLDNGGDTQILYYRPAEAAEAPAA